MRRTVSLCALIVVAIFAPGCFSAPPPEAVQTVFDPCEPLILDVAASALEEERASVVDAATMWNDAAGLRLSLATDAGAGDAPRLPVRFEEAAPLFYGLYEDERGEIYINRNLADRGERAITVAHEVGHAFGLLHVKEGERRSLMNPGNLENPITDADVLALEGLWGRCR